MKIDTILDQIDLRTLTLPRFQRGYVWNREQVRRFMSSLYHRHPVGGLIIWVTETADTRGNGSSASGSVRLIIDGQQRLTTLYGIDRGKPPPFFEGNPQAFTGLYFDLENEVFEFYSPQKMRANPLWVNVTELFQHNVGAAIQRLNAVPELRPRLDTYVNRLTTLYGIKQAELHIEEITGADKTVDVVVGIFDVVNSGGTKLSKGDLALARVCAQWPEARDEMQARLDKWRSAGFLFKLEWLLRCMNTLLTGEATFSALKDESTPALQEGLLQAERAIDMLLNMVSSRLGLDHDRVFGSRYALPLLARYFKLRNWQLADHREADKLLYWYIQTLLWGRYTGSTETVLAQDLRLIAEHEDGALDRLIAQLRQERADLRVRPEDFGGYSRSARFYPLLYLLTRVWKARDLCSGIEISRHLLGKQNRLELHHVFPRAVLRRHGYSHAEVNAIANYMFLTRECNERIADSLPASYLEEFSQRHPGVVESHWIPTDRHLWKVENYRDFLAARRQLLANAANEFLDSLLHGRVPKEQMVPAVLEQPLAAVPGGIGEDEEERILREVNEWVVQQGLPSGELAFELVDPATGTLQAIFDLAWPNGLQEGYSPPVALLINEGSETVRAANSAGYRYFTDADAFRAYVRREILALEDESA